ncbi:MAG: amidohydrolase [Deltaproteobacteria bacterium]|jgi:imidazolonepropionase-like amidohydrolase|nr:amidohydrolase [Deltaproteobacteria bacterium]MBT6431657.1 amidohydrolase [Deltaproteobacteria bacterium]MBT6489845.1 amidohydrolase [Deltaproteobacteria bacterium]
MTIRPLIPCLLLALSACASSSTNAAAKVKEALKPLVYPSEPADMKLPVSAATTIIDGATILTAAGPTYSPGYIVFKDGKIQDVGEGAAPTIEGAAIINAKGQFVTPGIIDTHSHMGVYANPGVRAHSDGNEMVRPTTPEIWAEHAFWPQDPMLWRAVEGGITTIQVLPGSGNLIGGRSFTAKLHPAKSARAMRFPGAPHGLKIACGENPKRVYGKRGGPQTRMGNVYGYRRAFQKAREYQYQQTSYARNFKQWESEHESKGDKAGDPPSPPNRDFGLETLVGVLEGKILVHNHCYRADEMHIMLDLAEEFGFKIRSFHHALEAYKLADRLAETDTASSTWADWWGFKMEAFDGIPQNAALLSQAGARVIIHSDSATEIRHLNHEAAKAKRSGKQIGLTIDDNEVLRWITANPAWGLGILEQTGTLEKGKMADVVIWNKHPFSVYAKTTHVFIDGQKIFDRTETPRLSDFEIGHPFDIFKEVTK